MIHGSWSLRDLFMSCTSFQTALESGTGQRFHSARLPSLLAASISCPGSCSTQHQDTSPLNSRHHTRALIGRQSFLFCGSQQALLVAAKHGYLLVCQRRRRDVLSRACGLDQTPLPIACDSPVVPATLVRGQQNCSEGGRMCSELAFHISITRMWHRRCSIH
jgi:hypothetical protein